MAEQVTQVLGIVGMSNKGEYSADAYYEKLNVVTYQGSSYSAKTDVHGIVPTNTDYWQLLASKGEKGDKGDTGNTGQDGHTPVKGTDYYTASDIADLESTLSSDVTSEVSEQLSELTSATPLVASSTSDMSDTTRIYVNTTDGHWYWYNGTAWTDGGVYQAAEDSDTITRISNELNNITNRKTKYFDETNTIHLYSDGEKLVSYSQIYSAFFPIEQGKKYVIEMEGAFNRKFISLTNSLTENSPANDLVKEFPHYGYNKFEFQNSDYNYVVITYGYLEYDNTYISITEGDNSNFMVNGVEVVENKAIEEKLGLNIKKSIFSTEQLIKAVSNAASPHTFQYSEYGRSILYHCKKNTNLKISAVGNFNRFAIYGYNYSDSTAGEEIHRETGTFTSKECVIENTTYDVYSITLGANVDETFSIDAEIIEYTGNLSKIKIEGVEIPVYENDVVKYLQYVSTNNVNLVNTTSELYALFDELVSVYPNYVSKNILGQNSLNTDINEYVFSTGNYNAIYGNRPHTSTINKPKILLVSGVHGDEKSSVMGVYNFLKDLCKNTSLLSNLRENYEIRVIPIVTPYAYDNDRRANENDVNINRNFNINWIPTSPGYDYSGPSAASENETQIVQNWLYTHRDAQFYIDYHNSGYVNEISYLGKNNENFGIIFLKSMSEINPFWISKKKFLTNYIFQYIGNISNSMMSTAYANSLGLNSNLLEASWNVKATGKHSTLTIETNTEVIGNLLLGYTKYKQ